MGDGRGGWRVTTRGGGEDSELSRASSPASWNEKPLSAFSRVDDKKERLISGSGPTLKGARCRRNRPCCVELSRLALTSKRKCWPGRGSGDGRWDRAESRRAHPVSRWKSVFKRRAERRETRLAAMPVFAVGSGWQARFRNATAPGGEVDNLENLRQGLSWPGRWPSRGA